MVEHLLSALEAKGVDNCRIQVFNEADSEEQNLEVPIFDGSARVWVESLEQIGLQVALDSHGNSAEKMVAHLNEPLHVRRNDSFVAAFPSQEAPAIGCQWFSSALLNDSFYDKNIASSRTFCIYEEVEHMRNLGIIKGGSLDNAIVCSSSKGWLNPPLRFDDEPCRHKVLDIIGDLSLFARPGSQGLPIAHIVAFKGGHTLHAEFVRHLSRIN
jgi:UDP-3-O-[3-hydroxymyristoyl] N-acetylglucosamine deacetylase